jgi:hypothetical protein
MLSAISQPLEVHQVGGASFLESLIGPLLIAAAAVLAASLAAWVARKNHSEQLANDRAMRNLDHARRSIGAAVETIQEGIHDLTTLDTRAVFASEATRNLKIAEAVNDDLPWVQRGTDGVPYDTRDVPELEAAMASTLREEPEDIEAEAAAVRAETEAVDWVAEQRTTVEGVFSRLLSDTLRLRIAIGEEDDILDRHQELVNGLRAWANKLRPDMTTGEYDVSADAEDRVVLMNLPLQRFTEACQRWSAQHGRHERQIVERSNA